VDQPRDPEEREPMMSFLALIRAEKVSRLDINNEEGAAGLDPTTPETEHSAVQFWILNGEYVIVRHEAMSPCQHLLKQACSSRAVLPLRV
jgi:hypothetical protein